MTDGKTTSTYLPDLESLVSQDDLNQLNCRTTQILTFAASRTRWADLLMYCSLECTLDVFRHCYLRNEYRWSYRTRYVNENDLALLGFDLIHIPQWDVDDFRRDLPGIVSAGHAVLVHLPRGHFAYWRDFLTRFSVPVAEHMDLHSFLVCGIDPAGDLTVVDNANQAHAFQRYILSAAELDTALSADAGRCLVGNLVVKDRRDEPDIAGLLRRYTDLMTAFDDSFEIYDRMAESLSMERITAAETYQSPAVNSLAILAGSRSFFSRFLALTSHSVAVKQIFAANAEAITRVLNRASQYHAGVGGVSMDALRRQLSQLRRRERQALHLLKTDLGRSPIGVVPREGT
ncbi:hypothetical protein [Actinoplanes utahensis]|nr:hypothetical protein [Actinoplanes utahensis]GIF33411.1 hypothetical protein Aut01nite_63970 [Actinoplanes utahensis]